MGNWTTTSVAGAGGGGAVPPAPNLASAEIFVITSCPYNESVFQLSGSLTPSSGDLTHLKRIHVEDSLTGLELIPALFRPPGGWPSPITFATDTRPMVSTELDGTLTFYCENDVGDVTPDPISADYTVDASLPSAVSAADGSTLNPGDDGYHVRWQDGATALHTVIAVWVTLHGAIYPQMVTIWFDKRDGKPAVWQGWFRVKQAAGLVMIGLPDDIHTTAYPPSGALDDSWVAIAATGVIGSTSPIPVSAVRSDPFTVPTIPAPGPRWSSGCYIDELTYGNNGQVNTWGWKGMFATLPYDNPDFFLGRWTVQNGSYSGGVFTRGTALNHAWYDGDEQIFTDDAPSALAVTPIVRQPGSNHVKISNPLMWPLPAYRMADGTLNPNTCMCFRHYAGSRRNTDGSGGTLVLEECWSSGVGVSTPGVAPEYYVVLDLTKAQIPSNNLNPTLKIPTDTIVLGPSTQKDSGTGGLDVKVGTSGVTKDGSGNLVINLGTSGVTVDGSGHVIAKIGTDGITTDGTGGLTVKLGNAGITTDGSGNLVFKNATNQGLTVGPGGVGLNLGNGMVLNSGALQVNLGDGLMLSGSQVKANFGNGLTAVAGVLTVNLGNGLTMSGSQVAANLGNGMTLAGGAITLNLGNGLTMNGSQVQANLGNGMTLFGGAITLNLGNGLTMSGSQATVNLGNGVTLSGSQLTVNLGNGLKLSGSQVVADLGNGLKSTSGHLEVDLGGGLAMSGTQVAVNAGTGLTVTTSISISNGGVGNAQISDVAISKVSTGTLSVGSGGVSFSGAGGLSMPDGGNISVYPGYINAQGGYKAGATQIQVIDSNCVANFASLKIQGTTRIDSSINAFLANIYRNGSELGNVFAAKGTYDVKDGAGTVIGTVVL